MVSWETRVGRVGEKIEPFGVEPNSDIFGNDIPN